jgi:hypothetical protein
MNPAVGLRSGWPRRTLTLSDLSEYYVSWLIVLSEREHGRFLLVSASFSNVIRDRRWGAAVGGNALG